jgi:cytochrome oxidase assembly protein ShyY1
MLVSSKYRSRFRAIPFIAAALAVVVGLSLGQWQGRRAAQKTAIAQQLSERASAPKFALSDQPVPADDMEYRKVSIKGEFVRGWTVYLDNRPYQGRPGFYVLMPFRIAGSDMHVLIERGWMPLNIGDRNKLFPYRTPDGEIEIEGIVRRKPGHLMQLGRAATLQPNAIVQNLEIAEFAAASKLKLQPFVVEQTQPADALAGRPGQQGQQDTQDPQDLLVRDWPQPSNGIDMHRGYAFQWYALAAMAFLFFIVTGIRRGTK